MSVINKQTIQEMVDVFVLVAMRKLGLAEVSFNLTVTQLLKLVTDKDVQAIGRTVPEFLRDEIFVRNSDFMPMKRNASRFAPVSTHPRPVAAIGFQAAWVKKPDTTAETKYSPKPGSKVEQALIAIMRSQGGATSTEIAKICKVSNPHANQNLRFLHEKGLVKKVRVSNPGMRQPRFLYKSVAS